MKKNTKIILLVLLGLFGLGVVGAFASSTNKVFVRTGMVITEGDKVSFEDMLPVAEAGQEIWTLKGIKKTTREGELVAKLSSLDFVFSGLQVEAVERTKYIVFDTASYKGGKYTFSNK